MAILSARIIDRLATAIEHASWLDPISAAFQRMEDPLRKIPLMTNLLSGTFLGHPAHPLLVTVPIGSWTSAAVLDILGQRKGAQTLVGLGVLGAIPTAATGSSDWHDTEGAEQRVGTVHALVNGVAIGIYALSYLERRRGNHLRGILWTVPGFAMVSVSGWLGGHLSYALGVGVDTTAFQSAETDWVDVAAAGEIVEGALSQATVEGVAVVLSRIDGEIVAYADRCTHRGGPLHEGTVVDGCVQCPWHSARFDLHDGAVARGPATRPAPSYQVKTEADRVWVQRSELPRTLRTNPVGA